MSAEESARDRASRPSHYLAAVSLATELRVAELDEDVRPSSALA